MRILSAPVAMLLALAACAGGSGGDREDDDGDDVADDTLGSTNVTNDTIDPTNFSTTGIDDTGTATVVDTGDTASETSANASTDDDTIGGTGGDGPTVVEVTPDAGASGIDPATTIVVTFSAAMEPASITVDDGTDCAGAIQLSDDDFSTCVAMSGAAIASDGDTTFTLTPADPLASATDYAVRVLADATSADGVAAQPFDSRGAFTVRYFHTIEVDGIDDWDAGETFPTSTVGHLAYTAWDDAYVYLAMASPDVATPNGAVWVVAYFGGADGTASGQIYNTQRPELSFDARWHLRWRADNTYTNVQEWDGDAWVDAPWQLGEGDVYQTGELVELRVARSDIGDPDTLVVHMGILREADGQEASWAAHPQGSYTDGYDPDYAEYWDFDLLGSAQPVEQAPSP